MVDVLRCAVCDVTPVTECSVLSGCSLAHDVCMECAMLTVTHEGAPRCPQCREPFLTITQKDGRYVVNLLTYTVYRCGQPYIVMSTKEMKIASQIFVNEGPDESGAMSMLFYVPKFLRDVETTGWSLVVTDAD